MNRILTECTRSIRLQADMSEGFLGETVNHAIYLVNMSPSTAIDLQIPEEIWRGVSVDYSTLRIFSCSAYSFVDSQKKNKLESKSKKLSSSGSPKESRVSDFGIPRKGAPLPTEMWSLMKNQCCKKSQRWMIKCIDCPKIREDKSSECRVQTPDAGLIIATSAVPRRNG